MVLFSGVVDLQECVLAEGKSLEAPEERRWEGQQIICPQSFPPMAKPCGDDTDGVNDQRCIHSDSWSKAG